MVKILPWDESINIQIAFLQQSQVMKKPAAI